MASGTLGTAADALKRAHDALLGRSDLQFAFSNAPAPPTVPDWLKTLAEWLAKAGPAFKWLFWIGLALGVGAILYFIARELLGARFPSFRRKPKAAPEPEWRPTAARARTLLEDADRLAAAGRYGEAARLILFRSIEDIDARWPNQVRPALTSRDIARLTILPDAARRTFAGIAQVVEHAIFGGRAVDAVTYGDCRDAYQAFALPGARMSQTAAPGKETAAFSARTVIALLVAGVFAFSALVVLSAYAPDLRGGSSGGSHALSNSAEGFAGMVGLLKAIGDPVVISRDPHARTTSTGLLILTPDADVKAEELADMTRAGPTLLILPKWEAAPDPSHPGWTTKAGVIPGQALAELLGRQLKTGLTIHQWLGRTATARLSGLATDDMVTGPIDQLQTVSGQGLIPLVQDADDPKGSAVLARTADSSLFILSDPDLMNTQGIKDLATAQAGVAIIHMLRKADGPIMFDVTLNGFKRSRNLLKLALEPPFLGATICLLAAALLMALQALTRFGAPRRAGRAIALGKLALADNSAALIRLARREPKMAGRYLDLTRASVAKALGAGKLGEADLNALLDRQAERRGSPHRLAALIAEAGAVKDRAALLRLAQNLNQWKTEMTGERR